MDLTINRGPQTLFPRQRHACVTDGHRFIYILGSQFPKAAKEVERYDAVSKTWAPLPSLITGGRNLSCCYFKTGQKTEMIWCLSLGEVLQRLKVVEGAAGTNIWEEVKISKSDNVDIANAKLVESHYRQGLIQLNANEILIFGGESKDKYIETKTTFIARVAKDQTSITIHRSADLPKAVLPESPGYVLNSFANFYFADNLSFVYRFNK